MTKIVIVGASLAGFRAAEELRHRGFEGEVVVVGSEAHLPYDRPPLSKNLLAGEWGRDQIALLPTAVPSPDELDLTWRLGVEATSLDVQGREIALGDGTSLTFDGLIIASGAHARTMPGGEAVRGVHSIRTLEDSLAIREAIEAGATKVVVIGAGFIGAEAAATCQSLGLDVVLLEAATCPAEPALGSEMGMLLAEIHRERGVDVRLSTMVSELMSHEEEPGHRRVAGVRLTDGSSLDADLVIVGIGVVPNTSWLEGSGLKLDNGVVCDETTLAAPGVVAAGDVARWPCPRYADMVRIEHWDNAITMGGHAAGRLLTWLADPDAPGDVYDPVPWFWSDQYDRKIQLVGRAKDADEVRVVDGSVAERRFVALYRRGDDLVGALAMNRPRPVGAYRRLLEEHATWAEALEHAGA